MIVLLVEEDPVDTRLVQELLAEPGGPSCVVQHASRLCEALALCQDQPPDVALLNLTLPDVQGQEALARLLAELPTLPVVVLSGMEDETAALEAVRRGAQDYLVKGRVTNGQSLKRILRYAIERAGLQAELARKNAELARSNAELEHFAFVASHDLQAPLSLVGMSLNLLQRYFQDHLDERASRIIARALDGTRRMSAMVDGLLIYARVGSRGKPFTLVQVEAALEAALNNLRMDIEANHATVTHDPLPTLMADDVQLTQVFQNLVSNAIKFHGAEVPRVHVGAARDGNMWVFSVRDNGIGIPPEKAEQVFVIFERLHTQQEYAGTGIGLATCKKIVERHGGRIWVKPNSEGGSTFYFTLPASPGME